MCISSILTYIIRHYDGLEREVAEDLAFVDDEMEGLSRRLNIKELIDNKYI